MRLFVAIGLEGEAAAALEQVRQRLAVAGEDLRWSRPEDRHVTLQFLGEVAPERVSCVTEALAVVRSANVPVRIAGLGFFLRAGAFWAGVDRVAELLALQQRIIAATRCCGFVAEPREYQPHVTLARTRGRHGARALKALQDVVERGRIRLAAEFLAREYVLYESFPGPEGPRYEVRRRFSLGLD
jgi:RNA 2',3'-cyclic 3'-phosphodiesterase